MLAELCVVCVQAWLGLEAEHKTSTRRTMYLPCSSPKQKQTRLHCNHTLHTLLTTAHSIDMHRPLYRKLINYHFTELPNHRLTKGPKSLGRLIGNVIKDKDFTHALKTKMDSSVYSLQNSHGKLQNARNHPANKCSAKIRREWREILSFERTGNSNTHSLQAGCAEKHLRMHMYLKANVQQQQKSISSSAPVRTKKSGARTRSCLFSSVKPLFLIKWPVGVRTMDFCQVYTVFCYGLYAIQHAI